MTRKASPKSDKAPLTLTDADITSQRAVPRTRLPGVLGARAATTAFGNTGAAPAAAEHDSPSDDARPAGNRRTPPRKTADAD